MADIEKISVGTTSYDIKDAKALHNTAAVGSFSLVERVGGSTSYPSNSTTNSHNVVLGYSASLYYTSAKYSVVIGSGAKFTITSSSNSNYATVIGYQATCAYGNSVALGATTYARLNGVSIGYNARGNQNYCTAVGASASADGSYSTAIGCSSKAAGYYDVALGYNAQITNTSGYSVQLGTGTNANGGLQYRSWQLLDNNGIIPIDRIPKDLVVTTTDPLPNPDLLSVGTTQMYLGEDTGDFKKNHMYSVAEDKNKFRAFPMDYNPNPTISPDFNPQRDVQVDAYKLTYKLAMTTTKTGGKPIDATAGGMWSNRYVPVYYTGDNPGGSVPANMFYVGASYENKTETLYYDYTNGPYITRQQLEDDWGIKFDLTKLTYPTYQSSLFYIILADQFFLYDPVMPSSTYFYACAKFDRYGIQEWCSKILTISQFEAGTQTWVGYKLKTGDRIKLIWYANASINPDEGGAWWIHMKKAGESDSTAWHYVRAPQDGQHTLTDYWTTADLKRDWGISDVGTGLYANRTALSGMTFKVGWEYGHKWVEASFDPKAIDGYSTTGTQVLKSINGEIQWVNEQGV